MTYHLIFKPLECVIFLHFDTFLVHLFEHLHEDFGSNHDFFQCFVFFTDVMAFMLSKECATVADHLLTSHTNELISLCMLFTQVRLVYWHIHRHIGIHLVLHLKRHFIAMAIVAFVILVNFLKVIKSLLLRARILLFQHWNSSSLHIKTMIRLLLLVLIDSKLDILVKRRVFHFQMLHNTSLALF